MPAVVDRASSKQGKFLPGSHIPVISPEQLSTESYDSLLVLPWNLIDEVRDQFPDRSLLQLFQSLNVGRWGVDMSIVCLHIIVCLNPSISQLML